MTTDKDTKIKDQKALHHAMRTVTPLKVKEKVIHKPKRYPPKRTQETEETDDSLIEDKLGIESVSGLQPLSYGKSGLSHRMLRKLRRGQFPIERKLDLHGLTINEGRITVKQFLEDAHDSGYECVCIIHGKGNMTSLEKPKLKNALNNWLRQYAFVKAFCSAQPKDGGTGAVYVLLKLQH